MEPSFSQNVTGRLALTKMTAGGTGGTNTFYEMYSYDPAGRVMKKRLRIYNNITNSSVDKDIEYSFTGSQLEIGRAHV